MAEIDKGLIPNIGSSLTPEQEIEQVVSETETVSSSPTEVTENEDGSVDINFDPKSKMDEASLDHGANLAEFIDENGHIKCPFKVWEMVLKFDDFWTKHKPTLIESEIHLFSDKYKFAGTSDLIVEMNNERWIIDMKTSNSLHTSYDLQLAAYAKAWDELYEEKIDKVGILWLKSSKRGEDKKGEKIQGKGWELYESPRNIKENFELFEKVYDIFKLENPNPEPMLNSFPMTLQLKN